MLVANSDFWFWDTPSWGWAQGWALAVLVLVSIIPVPVPRKRGRARAPKWAPLFIALVNGTDGRWSTSKMNAVLWTYAVWYAFIAILLRTNATGLDKIDLKSQYLALIGFPVATAVIAKGITQSKVESGKIVTKQPDGVETNPVNGVGQLVTNDRGQPDLLDLQYFGFNLILLAYFFIKFVGHKHGLDVSAPPGTEQGFDLPSLPQSLVALTGVSAAGYVGKKGVQNDTQPGITTIDPRSARPGEQITIHGANFTAPDTPAAEQDVHLRFGDVDVPTTPISETKLTATIPADAAPGQVLVRVVNHRGATSDPYSYTIKPPEDCG